MRISDWSSDVCSSDLAYRNHEQPFWTKTGPELSDGKVTATIKGFNEMGLKGPEILRLIGQGVIPIGTATIAYFASDNPINEAIDLAGLAPDVKIAREITDVFQPVYEKLRSEEHTSELQSLMRISYAGFCLKKKQIS